MEDASELFSLAHKCRRLADAISEGPARDNLLGLADEYEHRAKLCSSPEDKPLMNWHLQQLARTRSDAREL